MIKKLMVLPLAMAAMVAFAGPAAACGDDKNCEVCEHKPAANAPAKQIKGELVTESFKVSGLKCEKCVKGVSGTLSDLPGVSKVEINLASHTATVTYGKGQTDLAKLNAALKGHFKLEPAAAAAGAKAEQKAPAHKGH